MKRCEYCGKDNDEGSAICRECGTPFVTDSPALPSPLLQAARTPLGVAVTTGAGVLLILAALFSAIGRAAIEIGVLPYRDPPGATAGMYSFTTSHFPAPLILLSAILPTFTVCRARCGRHAITTACASLLALAVLALLPMALPIVALAWCPPALVFGELGRSSWGWYLGAAVQCAAGACLLIWPRRPRNAHEPPIA
jgi:hypothetical protein